jgi:tetratricopeptide (TPR) repeat protein
MTMRPYLLLLIFLAAFKVLAADEPAGGLEVPADVLKDFKSIEELTGKSAYPEAAAKAEALLPRLGDNPQARALLLRNLASLYGLQKHYAHAAHILEQALALDALPAAEASKSRQELGQYLAAAGEYARAAEVLASWLETAQAPRPEQYLWVADLRTRLKQYPLAIAYVEKAIAVAPQPKPEWLRLLLGLYHEQHDLQGCAKTLRALIELEPENPSNWNQLTGIYQEAGQEAKALAVQQLMYRRGLLNKSSAIIQLAQVMRSRGLYSRSAELLAREMDKGTVESSAQNLELLAGIWVEARELNRAAAVLEKSLAMRESADGYHRLGQIYSEIYDWGKARQALSRAITRGGLKNTGGAYLLLGLANYRLNAKEQAREAFVKAQEAPTVRKTAQQWLEHMEREARQRQG